MTSTKSTQSAGIDDPVGDVNVVEARKDHPISSDFAVLGCEFCLSMVSVLEVATIF